MTAIHHHDFVPPSVVVEVVEIVSAISTKRDAIVFAREHVDGSQTMIQRDALELQYVFLDRRQDRDWLYGSVNITPTVSWPYVPEKYLSLSDEPVSRALQWAPRSSRWETMRSIWKSTYSSVVCHVVQKRPRNVRQKRKYCFQPYREFPCFRTEPLGMMIFYSSLIQRRSLVFLSDSPLSRNTIPPPRSNTKCHIYYNNKTIKREKIMEIHIFCQCIEIVLYSCEQILF